MCMGPEIATIVGVALAAGTTAYSLSQGTPSLPTVNPPQNPPAPPPPPAPAAPPPTTADTGTVLADDRKARARRFGVQETLLTSPLGGGGRRNDGAPVPSAGRSILGG